MGWGGVGGPEGWVHEGCEVMKGWVMVGWGGS